MPKISIITTTYKHQDFIAKTIESILSQSFTDWELLIGDDSPNYETWNIIQKYVEKYPEKIKAWHHSQNKGIVNNMNFLFEMVDKKTEFITFLEGDDLYTYDNLENKIKYFLDNPNTDFLYNGYSEINKEGNIINNKTKMKFLKKISFIDFLKYGENFIKSFGCVTLKYSIYDKFYPLFSPNGEKMFGLLDFFTYLRILPEINIGYLKNKIFFYRYHGNNFSGFENKDTLFQENLSIYEYYLEIYNSDKLIKKIILYRINYLKSIYNISNNNKIQSLTFLYQSFKYSYKLNIFNRIKILIRIIIPKFLNDLLIKIYTNK
ncbi:glycosyltransferase [Candidatus Gracilibacteria bacterium]|nr:glycosyltransferase [Candidatus Gracilibacteria bacterium]NUJ99019.1 glycosyltransferase [Candidatus Gracilibacteria bacterium]